MILTREFFLLWVTPKSPRIYAWGVVTSGGLLSALRRDKGGIPATTLFHNAALCGVVNVDDAEALAVAFRPLEVIQQRPDEITSQGYSLYQRPLERLNMFMYITYTLQITDIIAAIPL